MTESESVSPNDVNCTQAYSIQAILAKATRDIPFPRYEIKSFLTIGTKTNFISLDKLPIVRTKGDAIKLRIQNEREINERIRYAFYGSVSRIELINN